MADTHSDALVFFGATGEPWHSTPSWSLQAMAKRGHLDVPVIGVAKAGAGTLEQLRARARASVERYGGLNRAAFEKLCSLLRYVDGDYNDPATFTPYARSSAPQSTRRTISPSRQSCSGLSSNSWPFRRSKRRPRCRRKAFR